MSELRIVAGEWRGRRIAVPGGGVRPTADRVREAWLSIVRPALDGARVVDLCAGSGALGLEALSRGAAHCDFVEKDPATRRALAANIATLGAGDRATIHQGDALATIAKLVGDAADSSASTELKVSLDSPDATTQPRWDVAFADPPYDKGLALALAERWLKRPFAAIFGVEHEASIGLPPYADGSAPDRRKYGITALTFYHATLQHPDRT